METIRRGNIEWIVNPTNHIVGYLHWLDHTYKIIKVGDMYWLNQGLRVSESFGDTLKDDPFLSGFYNTREEFFQGENHYKLGDFFEAVFFSTGFFKKMIPPECRVPTQDEARDTLKLVNTETMAKDLNFADSEGNDIYTDIGEKQHRFWCKYGSNSHVRHVTIPPNNYIERIRVLYCDTNYDNNLSYEIKTRTSFFRIGAGALWQFGDWDIPNSPTRKRNWYNTPADHVWGALGAPDTIYYPGGIYTGDDGDLTLEEHLKEFENWVRDNPAGTDFWNPGTYWLFTKIAVTVSRNILRFTVNRIRGLHGGLSPFLGIFQDALVAMDFTYIARAFSIIPGIDWEPRSLLVRLFNAIRRGIFGVPEHNILTSYINTPKLVIWGSIAAKFLSAGWQRQEPRWAEFRLIVKEGPPDIPENGDPKTEFPDSIFFGSGY